MGSDYYSNRFLLLSGRSVKTKVFYDFSGRWSKVTSEIDNKICFIKVDIDKMICSVIGDPEVAGSSSQCDILHAASERHLVGFGGSGTS